MSSMINSSQEIFNELTISGLFGKWDVLLPPAFFFFFLLILLLFPWFSGMCLLHFSVAF